MIVRKKILQSVGAGALIAMFAGGAQANVLGNSSFESPDASASFQACPGGASDWTCFNNSSIGSNNFTPGGGFFTPTALTGTQVLKQFGTDGGAFQDAAANPGDTVDAQVFAMNWNGDNLQNTFLLQIFALDIDGNNISGGFNPLAQVTAQAVATGGTPDYALPATDGGNDFDWTQMDVSALMPAGTVSTRIQLIHVPLTGGEPALPGAIFLDDASLTVTAVPVPAAVWLFGSGLIGLVGVARRRKAQA
jgi:hypothetical protein